MREHDYLMERSHDYRDARSQMRHAQGNAHMYRALYLSLRKQMREYFKANPDIQFPTEIRKSIGMR